MVAGSFRPSRRILRRTFPFGIVLMFASFVWGSPQTFPTHIETDKTQYLSGETIQIVGKGFNPFERVTLRVTHGDGTTEPGVGHEKFFVRANFSGNFVATWSISPRDVGGLNFVISAEDSLGANDQTAFNRTGSLVAMPPVDLSSGKVALQGYGFNENELITVTVSDGDDHAPQTIVSEKGGRASFTLILPEDNPAATVFTVTAKSNRSGLVVRLSLTNYVVSPHNPNGVPALERVRLPRSLKEIGRLSGDRYEDFFITWNTAGWAQGDQTGSACALFDVDSDARQLIDLAVCGQVTGKRSTANHFVQSPTSPQLFTCDNREENRCGSPTTYGSASQAQTYVDSGALRDLSRNGDLTTSDDRATLRMRIDRTYLPLHATMVRVCSYGGASSNTTPIDCISADGNRVTEFPDSPVTIAAAAPALTGRIVYHSYASYNDGTSQLFLLNLGTRSLTNLSKSWTSLKDPMNAHWSPDGSKLVFMARPKKNGGYSAYFDIFLYTLGQRGSPENLTKTATLHDEDPKFSPDGSRVVYKVRPSTLVEMDLSGLIRNTIISSAGPERSMPYYTADASAVWFSNLPASEPGAAASIHRINLNGSNDTVMVDTPGVIDFYPIRDSIGQFLYARTVSPTNLFGQVYLFDGTQSLSLPFNTPDADYSDAFPLGTQYMIVSSTRAGGRGGYDLYITDRNTGILWPVSTYNTGVNTSREELGAAYIPN